MVRWYSSRRSSSSGVRRSSPVAPGDPGGEVQVHQLGGEPGRRPERGELAPGRCPLAGLLLELAARGEVRVLVTPSWTSSVPAGISSIAALGRDAPLADEQQAPVVVERRGRRSPPGGPRRRASRWSRPRARSCPRGTPGSGRGARRSGRDVLLERVVAEGQRDRARDGARSSGPPMTWNGRPATWTSRPSGVGGWCPASGRAATPDAQRVAVVAGGEQLQLGRAAP